MIVVLPSKCWHIADALAAEGFDVIHVDAHIRHHLTELDPPISTTPVLANMGGSGRVSDQLAERRRDLFRWQRQGAEVAAADEYRVVVSQYDRDGEARSVTHDVWDIVAERNPELRRMTAVLRRLLPAPDLTALEGDTVIVGVDESAQRALLPASVRCVAVAGSVPPWAVDGASDLHVIDAALSPEEQAAAALAAVRGLVTA